MGKFIYISTRRNLLYILNLIIFYYLRKVILIIIEKNYYFNNSLIFTFLMLFGEFCGGLSLHIYNLHTFKKDKKEEKKEKEVFGIKLIHKEESMMRPQDSFTKIIILIFFAAFFDFVEFSFATFYMPKFPVISPTAEYRFGGIIIIISALLCYYNLKMKIKKHQFVSLIIILISLIIIITFEIIFRSKGATTSNFLSSHIIVIGYIIFVPFTDIIEKYLMEFNFVSPFFILLVESIFGFILISIYSIVINPFKDINRFYNECSTGDFILLLFLLFLYCIFSGGTNIYKIITNGSYSPMAKTLAVYILNPLIYTYYFIEKADFIVDKERNLLYFLINIIFALITSFFACVFDEFIVLKCCGLDYETHHEISRRASFVEFKGQILMNDLETSFD